MLKKSFHALIMLLLAAPFASQAAPQPSRQSNEMVYQVLLAECEYQPHNRRLRELTELARTQTVLLNIQTLEMAGVSQQRAFEIVRSFLDERH